MLSELFRIPYDWAGVPIFGFGLLLLVWAVVGGGMLVLLLRRHGLGAEVGGTLPMLLLSGAAILFLPQLFPEGLPIRGYGLMLLLGASSGVGLACHRARQVGLDQEVLLSLAFWMFISGILGARLFYVIEYWEDRFQGGNFRETILQVLNFPEGGLVVYGALLGAGVAFVVFTQKHRLPTLAMADLIAPSLAIGLAFGRLGCLLNGCCYGGPSTLPWAVTFPPGSPPYMDQIAHGEIPATEAMPARSKPVHPTQVYSAVNAGLLAWLLWAYYPFRRREGEVAALMLSIYPISRFLLEMIRIDESAMFGTGLSISQNISLVILVCMIPLWSLLRRQPRGLAWNRS